jgi:hypothetical protein
MLQQVGLSDYSFTITDSYLLRFSDHFDVAVEGGLGDGELVAVLLYKESFGLIQMPGGKGGLVCLFR